METKNPVIIFLNKVKVDYPAKLLHKLIYCDVAPQAYVMTSPKELERFARKAGYGLRVYCSDVDYKDGNMADVLRDAYRGDVIVLRSLDEVKSEFKLLCGDEAVSNPVYFREVQDGE